MRKIQFTIAGIVAVLLTSLVTPALAAESPVKYDETKQINRWPTTNSVTINSQFEMTDWNNPVGMCEFQWSRPNSKTASMKSPKCSFKIKSNLPVSSGWNDHTVSSKKLVQMINAKASFKASKFLPIALDLKYFDKKETSFTKEITCSGSPKSDSKTNGYVYVYPIYQVTRSTFRQNYESDFKGRRKEYRDIYSETKVPAKVSYRCGAAYSKPANTGSKFVPTASTSKWTGTRLHLTNKQLVTYGKSQELVISQKDQWGGGGFSSTQTSTTGVALGVSAGWVEAQLLSPKTSTKQMDVICEGKTTATNRLITTQAIGLRYTYTIEKRYWDAIERKYVRKQETKVKETPLGVRCKHTNK